MEPRRLVSEEQALLDFLLSHEFPGAAELRAQGATVRTTGSSCDCGCPSFGLLPDRALRAAPVHELVPAEAHGRDPGGNLVGVLLFVTEDGYLDDVEVFGYDGSTYSGLPRPEALQISEWSEPDAGGSRRLLNP